MNNNNVPVRFKVNKEKFPETYSDEVNPDLIKAYQSSLEAFLSNLQIIRNKIDLGYNDRKQNNEILQYLPNIYFAYI